MEESISLAVAFFAGVLSFLSPCVLPLVPSYIGFVTGMTLDDLREGVDRRAVLVHSSLFVAGFSLIFITLGASASLIGRVLFQYQDWIARIGGVIILVFGLHLLGVFRVGSLLRERRLHLQDRPAGYAGSVVIGMAFGAGWTPCIGPVLGAVLTYASVRATMGQGILLLASYSLGLAVPFLGAALATGWFLDTSRRFRRAMPVAEKVAGAVLVLAGVLLVTGSFTVLSGYFARWTPGFILDRL